MFVNHCLVIRSGFEPETHSLEGCCSIQLSYQTSSECACRMNDALSASLGRPRFLLLTQTHEVWVRFLYTKLPMQAHKQCLHRQFGCKITAFFSNEQIILQFFTKVLQKASANLVF